MRHTVVPLLEVGEHTDRVRLMDMNLPHTPLEQVQLDLTRLERAMHWGGIKLLALGSYEGEGTEYSATNFCFNPDGTVSATKSKIASKAKLAVPTSENLEEADDYRWRNTAVYFNTTGMAEKEKDVKTQVDTLDKSLRTNLLADIGAHEVSPKNIAKEVVAAVGGLAAVKALPDPFPGIEWEYAPILLLPKPALPVAMKLFNRRARQIAGVTSDLPPKYSTMFYWRFDRALLASRHLARRILSVSE